MIKNFKRGMISYEELCLQVAKLVANPDHIWIEDEKEALEYVGKDYFLRR